MFARLLKPKSFAQGAEEALYACALAQTRRPVFYRDGGVPDTFDGRFDLLLLHVFLILRRLMEHPHGEELSQGLFDAMFKDMDQTLRERGIGDMGVPKHMRRMMKAFNGRMHAYFNAVNSGEPEDLREALRRNLFGTLPAVEEKKLARMAEYTRRNMKYIRSRPVENIAAGSVTFVDLETQEQGYGR